MPGALRSIAAARLFCDPFCAAPCIDGAEAVIKHVKIADHGRSA
ncbi:MAG: hypothetical protein QM741_08590 [Rudaea sp.]